MDKRKDFIRAAQYKIGVTENSLTHHMIIDIYNGHKPMPRRYKVKYTDAWCATFVSFCAMAAALSDFPFECSCEKMIAGFQKLGRWIENDAYIPAAGDIIFYDWQDTGLGDNHGAADHVGIVENVTADNITVIEGNYSNAVKRRIIKINNRYIRGFAIPLF